MQFKKVEIMKNITQPISRLVRFNDVSINSLNAMAIRVLIDVDVHLPLKWVLVVNGDEELPTFISYENLFEFFFTVVDVKYIIVYVMRKIRMSAGSWLIRSKHAVGGFHYSNFTLGDLDNYLIVCFPQPPKAVTDGAHFGVGADDSKRNVSWALRKRRIENERDSEDESAGTGDGVGANN
ncbi:hypothetical protein D8674_006263 [Pyrus ussuriensis x Pyrus communis]|uniref:Uncharacterized protein n=1 Tax=Pyrus ussuriensis x Pyrus communis TaxID=2448454 RepID=A0A5N5FTT3_9ROSA|nr:hypothetical protein D8674_006263 [Pyrus ussuriensis x Pyrus communis]